MKRFKGPELKLSEMKVPAAVSDIYYDLRDRRLLPLVALVIVAILAVPFLLTESGSSSPAVTPAVAVAPLAGSARPSRFTVTQVDPGLRVPGKRLAHRPPVDPFVQKFASPAVEGGSVVTGATASSSGSEPTTVATVPTGVESAPQESPSTPAVTPPKSGGNPGGAGSAPGSGVAVYAWAIDLKIVKTTGSGSKKEKAQPETRDGILPPAVLPSKNAQVVTYLEVNPETGKPLLLVSTDVGAVFGEWQCVAGTETCQLLEADPDVPETFLYGENNVRYKITVLSVKKVLVPTSAASSK